MKRFEKDPQAILDYGVDWSDWLASGDRLIASTWTVPAGLTKDSDGFTDTATAIWLSGGTLGQVYTLVNHITTLAGRQEDRTLEIWLTAQ